MKKLKRKKLDDTSKLILKYKRTKDEKIFAEIQKKVWGLPIRVMNKNRIINFSRELAIDILQDCRTLILLEAIKKFNSRKSNFNTFYTFRLMSYVNSKARFFLRRVGINTKYFTNKKRKKVKTTKKKSYNVFQTFSIQALVNDLPFENIISSKDRFQRLSMKEFEISSDIKSILTETQYEIIHHLLSGYNSYTTSQIMHLSQNNVNSEVRKIKKRIEKYMKSGV